MYGEEFPTPETQGRMSTSFGCSDFWDRLGGQAMLWLVDGILKATIDQSQVTLLHPNESRNHCAESLHPFPL